MTTIAFNPNNNSAPPFQATVTLDGASYSLQCVWNFYAQRWYIALYDQSQDLIYFGPRIESPVTDDLLLAPGVLTTSTIVFRAATNSFEISP